MAMANCPECGKEISSEATVCPHCGHPLKQSPRPPNSEPKSASRLKTGAIVNLVGGLGFMAMMALMMFSASRRGGDGTTISMAPAYGETSALLWDATFIILAAVTAISIAILLVKKPRRKQVALLTGTQLFLATSAVAIDLFVWNLGICCGMWIELWGTAVQLVGSLICVSGAMKLDK